MNHSPKLFPKQATEPLKDDKEPASVATREGCTACPPETLLCAVQQIFSTCSPLGKNGFQLPKAFWNRRLTLSTWLVITISLIIITDSKDTQFSKEHLQTPLSDFTFDKGSPTLTVMFASAPDTEAVLVVTASTCVQGRGYKLKYSPIDLLWLSRKYLSVTTSSVTDWSRSQGAHTPSWWQGKICALEWKWCGKNVSNSVKKQSKCLPHLPFSALWNACLAYLACLLHPEQPPNMHLKNTPKL